MLNFSTGETLYGLASTGKYKVWSIKVVDATVKIVHGYEDGVLTEYERTIPCGKNIGKANETSASQQAILDATSRYNKQMLKGYRSTKAELSFLPVTPMLAQSYTKNVHKIKDDTIYIAQPKLNGVRCTVQRHGRNLKFSSRQNKDFTEVLSKHKELCEELLQCLPDGEIWDGELYVHGCPLQDIVSYVKRFSSGTLRLNYWVYDVINTEPQFDRIVRYTKDIQSLKFRKFLVPTPYDFVKGQTQIQKKQTEYLFAGYEGLMLRSYSAMYQQGKRSYNLLKYKNFQDEEFTIVDYDFDCGMRLIWICEHKGKRFSVVPKASNCVRSVSYENQQYLTSCIGEKLTVRFSDRSKDGTPIGNPVGLAVRNYE